MCCNDVQSNHPTFFIGLLRPVPTSLVFVVYLDLVLMIKIAKCHLPCEQSRLSSQCRRASFLIQVVRIFLLNWEFAWPFSVKLWTEWNLESSKIMKPVKFPFAFSSSSSPRPLTSAPVVTLVVPARLEVCQVLCSCAAKWLSAEENQVDCKDVYLPAQ